MNFQKKISPFFQKSNKKILLHTPISFIAFHYINFGAVLP